MDLIDRQAAIDAVNSIDNLDAKARGGICFKLMGLPSAQPEEAIPISWIEAIIKKFMMAGDAFSGLTASIIRVMLNEWKKEQEGGTDEGD